MITPSYNLTATERVLPRLALDFTTASLDSRITFTRALNTATRVNASGLIEIVNADLPRFDYDPVTLVCKGLLIEESRINNIFYSYDFGNSAWGKTGATVSTDQVIAPNGNLEADQLIEDTASSEHRINQNRGYAPNDTLCFSVYVKSAGRDVRLIMSDNSTGTARVIFDLTNGVIYAGSLAASGSWTNSSASITNVGGGWYRAVLISTKGAGTTISATINATSGTTVVYAGNGSSGLYLWGAQLETGAFPTSYIPTTTGTATRNADVATMTGTNFSSWFNASEGTFVSEWDSAGGLVNNLIAHTVSDGTFNNSMYVVAAISAADKRSTFYVNSGGVNQTTRPASGDYSPYSVRTTVAAYKQDSFIFAADATSTLTDTTGTVPTVDRLYLGSNWAGTGSFINGHIAKFQFFPFRLTDAEVRAFSK